MSLSKALTEFAKTNDTLVIKGGVMDGAAIDAAQIDALAKLPPREALLAQLAGAMEAPMSMLASALEAKLQEMSGLLEALKDQKASEG